VKQRKWDHKIRTQKQMRRLNKNPEQLRPTGKQ
jgi:hypothetical protein